jgi:peptidoglycan/LPS O-acetylase OafA/YrhL
MTRTLLRLLIVTGLALTILAFTAPYLGLGQQQSFIGYIALGISRLGLAKFGISVVLIAFAARHLLTYSAVAPLLRSIPSLKDYVLDTLANLKTVRVSRNSDPSHPYRPDIDGMRALAIGSVLGFHAFPDIVPGGFIGVDVFFVISGYLISQIIFQNLDQGTFSFRDFYYRRIKRIFPALIVVLIGCYVIGWFFLVPDEFKQLGKHIASGAGFVSNFTFWQEAGYFDNDSKPLLHLWSLGVEEQFYIAWPFLLFAARKLGLNFFLVTLCVAIPSFLLNIAYVRGEDLVAAFYSPGARFWELMLGAMLASIHLTSRADWPLFRNLQSGAGLMCLYLALTLITRNSAFPGFWALLPTVGATLIIGAGPRALLNRYILSHPVFVGIGLISYPLYLWHMPLLTFARIDAIGPSPLAIRVGAVILSVLLAWATYKIVERPIRFNLPKSAKSAAALSAATLTIGLVGYWTMQLDGIPSRSAADLQNRGDIWHEAFFRYQSDHFYLCTPEYIQKHSLTLGWPARCVQSKPVEAKDVAIIGDSHAEDLFVGLAERLRDLNVVTYIQGALPVLSSKEYAEIFDYVEGDKNIKSVFLASFWGGRIEEVPKGSSLEIELTKTLESLVLSGKTVYLINDRPLFPFDPDVCKYRRRRLFFWEAERKPTCEFARSAFDTQRAKYDHALVSAAGKFADVRLLDTAGAFCDEKLCHQAKNQTLLYRERNHLTIDGSRAVSDELISQMTKDGDLRQAASRPD